MNKDTKKRRSVSKGNKYKQSLPAHLEHINKMAAGIDIGSSSHFVAVPEGCAEVCVREFPSFTTDLYGQPLTQPRKAQKRRLDPHLY